MGRRIIVSQEQVEKPTGDVIIGLAAIAQRFGRTRITAWRWIHRHGFPAAKLPDGQWATTPALIDNWILARNATWHAMRKAA